MGSGRVTGKLREGSDDVTEEDDFTLVALVWVLVVHYLDHFAKLLVALQLLTLEVKIVTQLSKANRTEGERLLVCLVQLRGAVHDTLVLLTMPHREDVA